MFEKEKTVISVAEQGLQASRDDLLEELLQLSREYQGEPHDDTPRIQIFPTRAEALKYSERLLRPLLSNSILTDMLGP